MTKYLEEKLKSIENMVEVYEGHKDFMIETFKQTDKEFQDIANSLDDTEIICTSHTLKNHHYGVELQNLHLYTGRRFIKSSDTRIGYGTILTIGTAKEEFEFFLNNNIEVVGSYTEKLDELHEIMYYEQGGFLVLKLK